MTTLSIVLPDYLANESKKVAQRLGVSRTHFIRQAISHELETLNTQFEQKAIIDSVLAMKDCEEYLKESDEITEGLNSILPTEEEKAWWNIKKS
jgi:predicted transcriptional regulator